MKNTRKCKVCKEVFTKKTSLQYVCSIECSIIDARNKKDKRIQEHLKQEKQAWRKRKEVLKKNIRTVSDAKSELQAIINSICRTIDKGHPCISSGLKNFKMDAGHYYSVGSCDALRFNLLNIYGQSVHDNQHKSGNIHGYIEGLIETFGIEHYETVRGLKLLYPTRSIKMTVEEIDEKRSIAKKILSELIKEDKTYSNKERILLRIEINKKIGIYLD